MVPCLLSPSKQAARLRDLLVELTNIVIVNSTNISTNIEMAMLCIYLLSPAKHAARLVGCSTAAKAGEECEKSEEDEGDDDEREVRRVWRIILRQAGLDVRAWIKDIFATLGFGSPGFWTFQASDKNLVITLNFVLPMNVFSPSTRM